MSFQFTILGCGSSGGMPRVGNDWGSCDPAEPRNYRRRCSLLVKRQGVGGTTQLLIDTSPDLREQALLAKISSLDGVWYSHEHADHTHGIDELRGFYLKQRARVPIWADRSTMAMLRLRFGYCFETPEGSDYPPILKPKLIMPGEVIEMEGKAGVIEGLPFSVEHGAIHALGFRIGNTAYTPDLNGIPDASLSALENLDLWIVDALKRTPHPSHFHLGETLDWIKKLRPRRAVLTNMHSDMDYRTLLAELPKGVEPAYDGMQLSA